MHCILSTLGRQLTTFQWFTLGFLVVMTGIGLLFSGRGEPLPKSVGVGFLVGTLLVLYGAFQSLGLISTSKVEVVPNSWDVSQDRKQRKLRKKKELQTKKDQEREAEVAARAEVRRVAALEKAAAKAASKAEAAKEAARAAARAKAAAATAKMVEEPKGKKKKKKKSKAAAKAAAAEKAEVETPEVVEEKVNSEDLGWVEQKSSLTLRNEKRQGQKERGDKSDSEMTVSPRHFAAIIGTGGRTKERLEEAAQVTLTLPKRDSGDDTVIINGTFDAIEVAKTAIAEIVEKGFCRLLDGDVEKITMEVSNLGGLIGPGGKYIDAIRTKTNVKINMPNKDSNSKTITILGETASITRAVDAINALLEQGYCDLTHENYTSVAIPFPGAFIGLLIGPAGEKIKKIQKDTDTRIKIPSAKTKEEKEGLLSITISGPQEGVNNAKRVIDNAKANFSTVEVDFPQDLINFVIGEKGKSIQALQKDTNTRIKVDEHLWDPSCRTIEIVGLKSDVQTAEKHIANILATHCRTAVAFPKDRLGALIGKGGQAIADLQKLTNTRISMKDHEWDDTVKDVIVEGLNEDVASAMIELDKLKVRPPRQPRKEVTPPEATKSFLFPTSRAGVIIGRGGSKIQEMQKATNTSIKLTDLADDVENKQITIEGSAENVVLACELVEALRTPAERKPKGAAAGAASSEDSEGVVKEAAHEEVDAV